MRPWPHRVVTGPLPEPLSCSLPASSTLQSKEGLCSQNQVQLLQVQQDQPLLQDPVKSMPAAYWVFCKSLCLPWQPCSLPGKKHSTLFFPLKFLFSVFSLFGGAKVILREIQLSLPQIPGPLSLCIVFRVCFQSEDREACRRSKSTLWALLSQGAGVPVPPACLLPSAAKPWR